MRRMGVLTYIAPPSPTLHLRPRRIVLAAVQANLTTLPFLLEIIGALLTLASVLTAAREHRSTWLFAGASALLYAYVYWTAGLRVSAEIQAVYLASSIYGLYHWGAADRPTLPIRAGNLRLRLLTVAWIGALTTLLSWLNPGGDYVLYDAFLVSAAITAQLLMTRKFISCWWYWILVNVGYLPLFYLQELWPTLVIYALLLPYTLWGARTWYAKLNRPPQVARKP